MPVMYQFYVQDRGIPPLPAKDPEAWGTLLLYALQDIDLEALESGADSVSHLQGWLLYYKSLQHWDSVPYRLLHWTSSMTTSPNCEICVVHKDLNRHGCQCINNHLWIATCLMSATHCLSGRAKLYQIKIGWKSTLCIIMIIIIFILLSTVSNCILSTIYCINLLYQSAVYCINRKQSRNTNNLKQNSIRLSIRDPYECVQRANILFLTDIKLLF